jgi:formylglycine-generating enzyme required for sulfatase activity
MSARWRTTGCVAWILLSAGCGTPGDSGADTGTDTEPFEWDAGPETPCVDLARQGEVCIPGGRSLMGCMPHDEECEPNERPMVEVTLSPFFIDQREVTWADDFIPFLNTLREGYIRMEAGGVKTDEDPPRWIWRNHGVIPIGINGEGDFEWGAVDESTGTFVEYLVFGDSVGGVSQLGAELFCAWKGRRLPTEAEWERAARGGATWIYPCGNERSCSMGNWGFCAGEMSECQDIYEPGCPPVNSGGLTPCPSPYGVYQMVGNAEEYVQDQLVGDHSHCLGGCVDPPPTKGGLAIVKGGSIGSFGKQIRISNRQYVQYETGSDIGIRCARDDLPPPDAGVDEGL